MTNKTIAQQQREWEQKQVLNKLSQEWDQASNQILNTAIDSINSASKKRLSDFSIAELEAELLKRQKCQFSRLTCTKQAEDWITPSQNPACFNCKQDILSILKDK